ncbi:hypothetical protein [Roseateles sp. BYS96W]|uniref:Uncharacterized protein n=1 Tax=Pelomonas nitida TaxID=3299027 RepID=A0ABW7G2Q2_9BURK
MDALASAMGQVREAAPFFVAPLRLLAPFGRSFGPSPWIFQPH